jgi:hypothetical protein
MLAKLKAHVHGVVGLGVAAHVDEYREQIKKVTHRSTSHKVSAKRPNGPYLMQKG